MLARLDSRNGFDLFIIHALTASASVLCVYAPAHAPPWLLCGLTSITRDIGYA